MISLERMCSLLGVVCLAGTTTTSAVAVATEPTSSPGSSIVVAGHPFEVGRPVVLWSDPQGFDAYQTRCIDQSGGCCDTDGKRYGSRKDVSKGTLDELQNVVSQLVLHFDGCVNSRSCFKSMHNRPRPRGATGCGLSAHFMIDADGTIYQTLDLVERAYHAEEANSTSVGVEICNRGRVDRTEWPKLPPDYRTRPTRNVVINGEHGTRPTNSVPNSTIRSWRWRGRCCACFPRSSRSSPRRTGNRSWTRSTIRWPSPASWGTCTSTCKNKNGIRARSTGEGFCAR